jgi:hypothetical protein
VPKNPFLDHNNATKKLDVTGGTFNGWLEAENSSSNRLSDPQLQRKVFTVEFMKANWLYKN